MAYPPSRQFPNFGGPVLAHSVGAAADVHQRLQEKRQSLQQFHQDRLKRGGLLPMAHAQAAPAEAVDEYHDASEPVEPHGEHQAMVPSHAEHYALDDDDSDATVSPLPSPRHRGSASSSSVLAPMGRIARAGFQMTGTAAGHVGEYAATSLSNNISSAAQAAQLGMVAVGHAASAVGSASRRAASTRAAQAHEAAAAALEPELQDLPPPISQIPWARP